jgi:hypothetical protein
MIAIHLTRILRVRALHTAAVPAIGSASCAGSGSFMFLDYTILRNLAPARLTKSRGVPA